jgi:hypothetical protein
MAAYEAGGDRLERRMLDPAHRDDVRTPAVPCA